MASPVIQGLRADVDAKNEFILVLNQELEKITKQLSYSQEFNNGLEEQLEYSRNLLNTTTQNYEFRITQDKQKIVVLELQVLNLEQTEKLLNSQLLLVSNLLQEEREESRETREMIYLRTGMKREVFLDSSDSKDEKDIKPQRAGRMSRSQIKNELEARAERLLAEQKAKEDAAITKGDLPAKEGVH